MSLFAGVSALAAPNDPLVSADDFAEWFSLGNGTAASLTELEQNRIQTALEIASATVRAGRRQFTLVVDDVVTIDGSGGCDLLLPSDRLPVVAVSNITNLGLCDTSAVTLSVSDYDWTASGIIHLHRGSTVGSWWTPRRRGVVVTYTHGYDPIPRDVASVVLDLAKRKYDNPSGSTVKSETIGDYSVSYDATAGGLLPDEELILRKYEAPV